ncbi:MAG: phosphatase PAP2 family protein [Actinomycetota bacterium]|nr:phosphatase PAP2 family protein [Acidimicrobiia bacterium]MDQ3294834.1 phosphatase PAP2 family protein [Actinomycetota bacterium]
MDHGLPTVAVDRLEPPARYGVRTALFAIAVVLATIPFGVLLQQVTTEGRLTELDTSAARWLHERVRDNEAAVAVLEVISFIGKPVFLGGMIAIAVLWLLRSGARRLATFLLVTSIVGGLVDTAIKVAVGRPRPQLDEPLASAFGQSFPSGHAMGSVFCLGALLLAFMPAIPRRWRGPLVGAAVAVCLAIGFSRLALGVHYITDVVGGYVLGVAWLCASVAAFEVWREDRGRRPTDPLHEGVEPEEAAELVS